MVSLGSTLRKRELSSSEELKLMGGIFEFGLMVSKCFADLMARLTLGLFFGLES
ncbi:predicted protein [Sclerotinia sclerotiorum 1980 UF-70]|uniref:Uncharacterized protein n=1 Tax=Sclerotinia sclerotiorum (strain ATCC 18683 / 1980 / Ss-1) TaxID=665079 RepID=A7EZA3_SCLS1|nr:predicted protein [Sclerotinia sclerotiorum 1980 UF-70]EDN94795.1 predicted protein [Sclerotinia sclerotiorum 1980 UF-70]